jgi:hypothetical protein
MKKTILVLLILSNTALAEWWNPNRKTVKSPEHRVFVCADQDIFRCELTEAQLQGLKDLTMVYARRGCVKYFGSEENCTIHDETYDHVEYPPYISVDYGIVRGIQGSIIITRKKNNNETKENL